MRRVQERAAHMHWRPNNYIEAYLSEPTVTVTVTDSPYLICVPIRPFNSYTSCGLSVSR